MQQNENFAKQAEQAEAERPEVVAYFDRNYPSTGDAFIWSNYEGSPYEPVMTVAQHERIVVAEKGKTAAAMLESHRQFVRQFEEGTAELIAQRDAALARVAELTPTRNRYGVDAHYFNKNLQSILRDFESFTTDELARSLIILAKVADEKVVAQAQHSVPEGYRLIRRGHFAAIKAQLDPEQVDAYRGRNIYDEDKVYANWNACRSALDEIKDVFQQIDWDAENELAELLAAAPGKEGV